MFDGLNRLCKWTIAGLALDGMNELSPAAKEQYDGWRESPTARERRFMTHDKPATLAIGPRFRWRLVRAGPLKLDGGSMFGLVPRALWGKHATADEQNRIALAHNCLLLERVDHLTVAGPQKILIEAGSGDKFDLKTRAIYGLTDDSVDTALQRLGVSCDEIDAVVLSHLHFDHAGGVTSRTRMGQSPDWFPRGGDASAGIRRTFGDAPIYVQRREWDDALANRSVMTRTYLRENLEPIAGVIDLVDSAPPFPDGRLPTKDQPPAVALEERITRPLPGLFVFRVPGHTWGQQAIGFVDDQDNTVVFSADLIPTVHHVGQAYNMAYDVEPYISTVTRRWFLHEAARRNWVLVLDHEPGNPVCRVREDGKGWYLLHSEQHEE